MKVTSGANAGDHPSGVFGWTVPIQTYENGEIAGPTVYGGLGCPSNEAYGEQPPVPQAATVAAAPGQEKVLVLLRARASSPRRSSRHSSRAGTAW